MKPTLFRSAAEFHAWLSKNHDQAQELLVGLHRKASGRGITYQEALDAALAFGWIDGVRKRFDENSYTIRFSPRRRGSIWSAVNTRRVEELIAQKRMEPPGLRVFQERDREKTRRYSYERERMKLDPALEKQLRANKKAAEFFAAQPPGYKRLATFWVMDAKKEETRARRMATLMACSARGKRIKMLNPNRNTAAKP